jgi:hypothetical protein
MAVPINQPEGAPTAEAVDPVGTALTPDSEPWQPRSTADNLRIVESIRAGRGGDVRWIARLIEQLEAAAGALSPPDRAVAPAAARRSPLCSGRKSFGRNGIHSRFGATMLAASRLTT